MFMRQSRRKWRVLLRSDISVLKVSEQVVVKSAKFFEPARCGIAIKMPGLIRPQNVGLIVTLPSMNTERLKIYIFDACSF